VSHQHTPGPWEIDTEWVPPEYPNWRSIKIPDGNYATASGHIGEANARLIAAAPDLLALAKQYASECAECHGSGVVSRQIGGDGYGGRCAAIADVEDDCSECADIRKVIAKAEGK
jgi:hypothetical protein